MKKSELNNTSKEFFQSEVASINAISLDEAKKMFPGVEFANSDNISYFPFILCNSFPNINARGRLFTPVVLKNSFNTIVDQLVDVEHQLVDHGNSLSDTICGHVKAVKFDYDVSKFEFASTTNPLPVIGLGCLYNRSQKAKEVLEVSNSNKGKWKVSMECGHCWTDAHLFYENKFIPITEADDGMIDCIQSDHIKPYKGKKLAVALGGLNGNVDFWGLGLTLMPADNTADVLGFVSARSRELSSKKIFYMPFESIRSKSIELANKEIETRIDEIASIGIIGQTEEENGHSHDILSNLTIMSANGHTHGLSDMNLSVGTKPKLTGVTNEHYDYIRDNTGVMVSENSHRHLVSIELKQKTRIDSEQNSEVSVDLGKSVNSLRPADTASVSEIKLDTLITIGDNTMEVKELLQKLSEKTSALVVSKNDDERSKIAADLATLGEHFKKSLEGEEFTKKIQDEIDKKVKAKELFTAEQVTEAVTTAVAEKEEEFKVKEKEMEVRSVRLQQCTEAGINLDFEFEDVKNADGKPITVRDCLNDFGVDESGDKQYKINFNLWKQLKEAVATPVETPVVSAEAANKPKPKPSLAIAGGGPSVTQANDPLVAWFK